MRVLILNADYARFLRSMYAAVPGLENRSYAEQMLIRNDSLFGVADYYSQSLRALGHEAEDIHVNNQWLQEAWARERGIPLETRGLPAPSASEPSFAATHAGPLQNIKRFLRPLVRSVRTKGISASEAKIVLSQIEVIGPDVILNQDVEYIGSGFLSGLRRPGRLIVGQIASPLPLRESYAAYDGMISSLPHFVDWFRGKNIQAALSRLAFESSILNKLGAQPDRDIPVTFVGSLSPEHVSRIELLEYIARRVPLKVWGNGIDLLPKSSPLWACYQGEAWGRDMYQILRRSRITLNKHIDLSKDMANNMRLYEATGMGALLLTDDKSNLADIFVPGRHVIAYRSAEECVKLIEELLKDEPRRASIAAAGQKHVIEHHSYALRMQELVGLLETFRERRSSP